MPMGNIPKFDLQKYYPTIQSIKEATGYDGVFEGTNNELLENLIETSSFEDLKFYIGNFDDSLQELKNAHLDEQWDLCEIKESILSTLELSNFHIARTYHVYWATSIALNLYRNISSDDVSYAKAQANIWSILFAKNDIEQAQKFFQNALDHSTEGNFNDRMERNIRACAQRLSNIIIEDNEKKDWRRVTKEWELKKKY